MSTSISTMHPAAGGFTPGLLPLPTTPLPAGKTAGKRRWHAVIAVLSACFAMLLFLSLAFHGYVAWVIAHPYVPALTTNPLAAKGLSYNDVAFPSKSGQTTVHGWYIPAGGGTVLAKAPAVRSERTIVFSHGYGANREESWVPMYDLAELLHELRYNVLMFDYGYASSGKRTPATGGQEESKQLLAAVQYARSLGAEQVVVWGFSMGAGTALQSALQTDASDRIDAMLLDSLFLPSSDSLYNNVRQYMKDLPRYPSIPLIKAMLPFFTGVQMDNLPVKQVLQTSYSMPIFIMHGANDAMASPATAEGIASDQHNLLSRAWIVKGGKHELLFKMHPKEYIQRAVLFLSQVDAARTASA